MALDRFKSSQSSGTDGESCVEIAVAPRTIHIRDSKNLDGPRLTVSPTTWSAFVCRPDGHGAGASRLRRSG
ncbi:DUF397 domain-containing protein [Streptomyces sp. NPDC002092]